MSILFAIVPLIYIIKRSINCLIRAEKDRGATYAA